MTPVTAILHWLKKGKEKGYTHMLVVVDLMDYKDYPLYVDANKENLQEIADSHNGPTLERVMECYDLNMDFRAQLDEGRAYHGWRPF